MSEPEFTEFKNFQNNSGNPENSDQICANGGAKPSGLFFYSQIVWVKTRVDGRIVL
jgi:hypothetical protein